MISKTGTNAPSRTTGVDNAHFDTASTSYEPTMQVYQDAYTRVPSLWVITLRS